MINNVDLCDWIKNSIISVSEIKETEKFNMVINSILSGEVVLFLNGTAKSLLLCLKSWEHRAVEGACNRTYRNGFKRGIY